MKNTTELSQLTNPQLIHIIIELSTEVDRLKAELARLKKFPASRK
jgi:hypothetical protein